MEKDWARDRQLGVNEFLAEVQQVRMLLTVRWPADEPFDVGVLERAALRVVRRRIGGERFAALSNAAAAKHARQQRRRANARRVDLETRADRMRQGFRQALLQAGLPTERVSHIVSATDWTTQAETMNDEVAVWLSTLVRPIRADGDIDDRP